jgi:hypothetical protein
MGGEGIKDSMSHDPHTTYRFLQDTPERPAWDVVAQRGDALLADAEDGHMRQDLLCALMLGLYPSGPNC